MTLSAPGFSVDSLGTAYVVKLQTDLVDRLLEVHRRMEEAAITREVIAILQAKGYVVREAEDFQATLRAERERVYAVYTRLVCEDECRCVQCLREESEEAAASDAGTAEEMTQ